MILTLLHHDFSTSSLVFFGLFELTFWVKFKGRIKSPRKVKKGFLPPNQSKPVKYLQLYWLSNESYIVVDRVLTSGSGPGRTLDVRPMPGSGRVLQKTGPGTGSENFEFSRFVFVFRTTESVSAQTQKRTTTNKNMSFFR